MNLPSAFFKRIPEIFPEDCLENIFKTFSAPRVLSVRVNGLKSDPQQVLKILNERKLQFKKIPWYEKAFILQSCTLGDIEELDLLGKGLVYIQGLSSMLVPLILDPRPGESVLDMCAAPGSKTSQIADLMNNDGTILAVEHIKGRYYKLKSVLELMGVKIAEVRLIDARRLRPAGRLFDKILVDAPCSSEGRFRTSDQKSTAYWSLRKIREMAHKQKGILLNAARHLKKGGVLVYSTCTFAPEENEMVIDWLLRKTGGSFQAEPVEMKGILSYPPVTDWQDKKLNPQVKHCLRVKPGDEMEGFFIAKLRRMN